RGGMAALSSEWAELSTMAVRLRRLSETLLQEDFSAVTEQAFGSGLRHILCAFDQDVEILGPPGERMTPISLWARTRPWARQIK
ncbi:unnamed protein product, partial [Prorocentrum cordatum]